MSAVVLHRSRDYQEPFWGTHEKNTNIIFQIKNYSFCISLIREKPKNPRN